VQDQVARALPEDFLTEQFQVIRLVDLIMKSSLLFSATCGEIKERVRLLLGEIVSRESR